MTEWNNDNFDNENNNAQQNEPAIEQNSDSDTEQINDVSQSSWSNDNEEEAKPKISNYAIAAMILACSGCSCSCITGIPAIVVAILALKEIAESEDKFTGKGLAYAAIVIAVVATFGRLIIILLQFVAEFSSLASGDMSSFNNNSNLEDIKNFLDSISDI